MKIHKGMMNLEIVDLLRAVAAAYKIADSSNNKFRIIAYECAADAVEHLSSEAKDLWDDGKLQLVSGIGPNISQHLGEIFETGKSNHFDDCIKGMHPAVFELIKVQGIGPKTAFRLANELKISTKEPLTDLEKKAKNGLVSKLEGFGEDSEKAILKSLEELKGRDVRLLLPYAEKIARDLINYLKEEESVERSDALGSLRRKASTVGDVDIAVSSNEAGKVIEHFCAYPRKIRVFDRGD